MISTLLVANRGEIARRVIRSARARGVRTVAVFSEPDAGAPHVREADRAVALRGATSTETYLDQQQILDAARRAGADAVHPGYGFLSENAGFARACADAGLTWVGPPPDAIETMGVKHTAKALARDAGVPTLPDALVTGTPDASDVGFPLLVKASAGGGGTGMRRVERPEDLAEAVRSARAEAARSFGDDTVFLERLLLAPRHVEIQVVADAHGHVIHLGERECSVQRRHQKVVEEAPSPAVTPQLRAEMGATAVALTRELGYVGVGTVEFLLEEGEHADRDGDEDVDSLPSHGSDATSLPRSASRYYFLEMNTRLQVEHPVTEEVYGLDLVALQLAIADGEHLPLGQDDVVPRGHAIEVRLYAEDPTENDRPAPGTLHRYRHDQALRWEDALDGAGEISAFYDPMLAKVIAHDTTRTGAARRLATGLAAAEIHGPPTNRDLLVATLRDPDFLAGDTHTDFLDRRPGLRTPPRATPWPVHLAAAAATTIARRREDDPRAVLAPPGWRPLARAPRGRDRWGDHTVTYRLVGDTLEIEIDGTAHSVGVGDLTPGSATITVDGVARRCRVAHHDSGVWVNDADDQTGWVRAPRLPAADGADVAGGPVSEVPGTVIEVLVAPGDTVSAGDRLVVLEAMKMEHPALAAADGIVETVHVAVGQYVEAHATLVTLKGATE